MSHSKIEKTAAMCSSCNEIHAVEIRNDGSLHLVGTKLINQCPCGADGLQVLQMELDP